MLQLVLLACGLAGAQPVLPEPATGEFRLLVDSSDPARARKVLQTRIQKAVASGEKSAEMYNRYVLGGLLHRWGREVEASKELEQAAALADSLKQRWLANRIHALLATMAEARGLAAKARQHRAAKTGDAPTAEDARAMVVVARTETDASERVLLLREALQVTRTARPPIKRDEADLLQQIGLTCLMSANYQCALENSKAAADLFDQLRARRKLAVSLRVQAQVHFEHTRYAEAEVVLRRLSQQELLVNDRNGDMLTQSMLALTLAKSGKREEALALLVKTEEGLSARQAQRARAPLAMVGVGYSEMGEHARAVALFERLLQSGPLRSVVAGNLARSYYHLGRYRDAIEAATNGLTEKSADAEEEGGNRDSQSLWWRARAREKLGETENALQDAMSALDAAEQARHYLVQSDFMKRGFADRGEEVVDFAVELAYRQKKHAEAFSVAEHARARAFLDLLASRGREVGEIAEAEPGRISRFLSRLGDPMVASETYRKPASMEQMAQLAGRIDSALLAYRVTPEVVYVWMLDARGQLHAASHRIGRNDLRALVDRVRKRSDTVDRGAWRALYAALIEPVRAFLPKPNALLTIIPHGPLFDLPFAALTAASGRHLIEDYRLHYAPSASMLEFTRSEAAPTPRKFLVVADPVNLPTLPDGKPLPPLPASRREARAIAASAPNGTIQVLEGPKALLQAVRDGSRSASVLHFATHAVIQSDRPMDSFLALANAERLTAGAVYDLTLASPLVVLSACRSATGAISADGVHGLTRAFFAAGAASVIASVWDVPDEPTSQLMAEFYKQLRSARTADALRSAQIAIMQRLRAGALSVRTPAGPAVLAEHPLLWAGFELVGEP